MDKQNEMMPPYNSTGQADMLLDLFGRVTPQRIDSKFIADNGIATMGNASKVVVFAKWLGLINEDGTVRGDKTTKLKLVGEERNKYIASLIKESYKHLFEHVNVETATRDDVTNYFVHTYNLGKSASQQSAMLFLHLCQTYGIPLAEGLRKKAYTPSDKPRVKQVTKISSPKGEIKANIRPEAQHISRGDSENEVFLMIAGKRHDFDITSPMDKIVFEAISKELLKNWGKQLSRDEADHAEHEEPQV